MNSYITGVDKNHEWMLKWWFNNIRKYSSLPITICDFGMSLECRDWAEKNADCFLEYSPHPKCAWFHKTQCLVDSPFEKTCWLDSDCEVVANIDDIFDYAVDGKVGLTKDIPRHDGAWWATGVIAVKGVPEVLKVWNEAMKGTNLRGDQEVFRSLLPEQEPNIQEIPNEYQWLRLQLARGKDNPNKKVIHWTGPTGKNQIRSKL